MSIKTYIENLTSSKLEQVDEVSNVYSLSEYENIKRDFEDILNYMRDVDNILSDRSWQKDVGKVQPNLQRRIVNLSKQFEKRYDEFQSIFDDWEHSNN